jgi:death-on-curing protein
MPGVRSEHLLASALSRPPSHAAFDEHADLITLGAMYAIAITRNHPFIDGNKRVAWVAMVSFLSRNGLALEYTPADAVHVMVALASASISDDDFTAWVRKAAGP